MHDGLLYCTPAGTVTYSKRVIAEAHARQIEKAATVKLKCKSPSVYQIHNLLMVYRPALGTAVYA